MSLGASRKRFAEAVVVAVLITGFLSATSFGQALGSTWTSTATLPTTLGLESCATSSDYGYVFCVGGETTPGAPYTNEVEMGTFSAGGGITIWNSTTIYPYPTAGQSCVVYAESLICVGGYLESGSFGTAIVTNSTYSAPILVSGLGSWTAETSYPIAITLESCILSGGYLDCIAGYTGLNANSSVYYSPITRSGAVGTWVKTTSYPISVSSLSCVAVSGYVYCVGGASGPTGYSDVYYAPLLSSGGVGAWTKTASYPTTIYSHSCAASSSYIYCIGGYAGKQYSNATYYAPLSATGLATWTRANDYPLAVDLLDCIVFSPALYCFGGYNQQAMSDQVYYNPIPPFQVATTTSTTTATITSPTTSTVTSTVRATTTVTSSVTSTTTRISVSTSFRTSTITSTTQNVSTTTTTQTTTQVSTTTVTSTTQTSAPGVGYLAEAGPAVVGIAAGVALTMLFSRVRRGGKSPTSTG